jgi:hypothetical protein
MYVLLDSGKNKVFINRPLFTNVFGCPRYYLTHFILFRLLHKLTLLTLTHVIPQGKRQENHPTKICHSSKMALLLSLLEDSLVEGVLVLSCSLRIAKWKLVRNAATFTCTHSYLYTRAVTCTRAQLLVRVRSYLYVCVVTWHTRSCLYARSCLYVHSYLWVAFVTNILSGDYVAADWKWEEYPILNPDEEATFEVLSKDVFNEVTPALNTYT